MRNANSSPVRIAAACLGGVGGLAAAIGVGQSTISNWLARGTILDAAYCVAIERTTSGVVTRRDLRPDDWREIWPELEEVEHLRAQVAQLIERLRQYEPDALPQAQEVT